MSVPQINAENSATPTLSIDFPEWRDIADDDLLVMQLSGDRRIVIRLASPYAPEHVANIRLLARSHWWDGESVYRVQDNWVVQWGDATEKKPLPPGIVSLPAAEYDFIGHPYAQRLERPDAYSRESGISIDGWAVAGDGQRQWLAHCYATIGVARDASPDTGTGAELFMPLGGSARRLDRNYTVVGRVLEGAAFLSALPRSGAAMGVYAQASERTPIIWVRLASDMPPEQRPHYQYRAPQSSAFAENLARRISPPSMVSSGGIDVCDVPLEVRPAQ